MRRFPKLRPTLWDGAVALAVAASAIALLWALPRGRSAEPLDAVVYIDGVETDRTALTGPSRRRVYEANGYTLIAEFSEDGARILQSDCPTQVCVHTGRVSSRGQAIICLPAGLVVLLEGEADDAPDAWLG